MKNCYPAWHLFTFLHSIILRLLPSSYFEKLIQYTEGCTTRSVRAIGIEIGIQEDADADADADAGTNTRSNTLWSVRLSLGIGLILFCWLT